MILNLKNFYFFLEKDKKLFIKDKIKDKMAGI